MQNPWSGYPGYTSVQVEDFNRNDPFAKVGLWKTVSIRPFAKRVDNR